MFTRAGSPRGSEGWRAKMTEDFPSNRVHQATGMISAQAECSLTEAMQLLILRADAMAQSIEATALDVLEGLIRFDDEPAVRRPLDGAAVQLLAIAGHNPHVWFTARGLNRYLGRLAERNVDFRAAVRAHVFPAEVFHLTTPCQQTRPSPGVAIRGDCGKGSAPNTRVYPPTQILTKTPVSFRGSGRLLNSGEARRPLAHNVASRS